jgi:hypothetical protein
MVGGLPRTALEVMIIRDRRVVTEELLHFYSSVRNVATGRTYFGERKVALTAHAAAAHPQQG